MDDLVEQLRDELRQAAAPADASTFSPHAVATRAAARQRRHRSAFAAAGVVVAALVVATGLAVRGRPDPAVDLTAGPATSATSAVTAERTEETRRFTFEGLEIQVPPSAVVVQGDATPCPSGPATVVEIGSARCPATDDHEVIRLRRVSAADAAAAASCRYGGVDRLVGCTFEERWHRTTLLDGGLAVDVELVRGREESGVAATISSTVAAPGPYLQAPLQLDGAIPPLKPGADPALVAAYARGLGRKQIRWVSGADNRLAYLFEDDSTSTRVEFSYGYDLVKGKGTWWTTAIQPA